MSKTKVVNFKDLNIWSVKNFLNSLKSNFPLVELKNYIIENKNKIKPFLYPNETFDILGVNNKEGVYFNETLLGSKIKQPYYQVNSGDIFYNPYRVNVGSIGIVPKEFDLKYTSPAYIVFRTIEKKLISEYLVFVLKSEWFNNHLRANTKGSVRQILSFSELKTLTIPLPPLEIQEEIVTKLQTIKNKIKELQLEEEKIKKEIEAYIYIALGLKKPKDTAREKIFTVSFKNLSRWDITHNQGSDKIDVSKSNYPLVELKNILDYEQPKKYIVSNTNYSDNFAIPVLTAGKTFILGYTDEDFGIFDNPPVIIFDDFTTAIQFVDFNFKVKSDALKILKIKDNTKTNIKFLYEVLKIIKIDLSKAHRRYYLSSYRYLKIPLPPIEIQNKIIEELEQKYEKIEENKQKAKKLEQDLYLEIENIIIK
ncbi:TPA: restriction endonuclease subunit S [Campylobacter jejuni]|nr:restriction endonuclease subunit S [Campylobacter jejuni]MCR8705026.1 restriction endonuclease subunit S [Campylobacter sp. 2352 PW]ECQ1268583.1 restriction endonuclease subunit S [Campylobacter jejuni]EFP2966395.1 restriction endonuclease subunit S [Campylobacter jejuni]EGL1368932.1 restriction endonuclease subunit S [Campylobacter jejuni]